MEVVLSCPSRLLTRLTCLDTAWATFPSEQLHGTTDEKGAGPGIVEPLEGSGQPYQGLITFQDLQDKTNGTVKKD